MTAGLVAFAYARLDEDERVARAGDVKQGDPEWRVSPVLITGGEHFTVRSVRDARPVARVQRLDGDEGEPAGILDGASVAEHIARWDPARVLAEVAAKRRILDLWEDPAEVENPTEGTDSRDWNERDEQVAAARAVDQAVRVLATVWAGHADYVEEWRP